MNTNKNLLYKYTSLLEHISGMEENWKALNDRITNYFNLVMVWMSNKDKSINNDSLNHERLGAIKMLMLSSTDIHGELNQISMEVYSIPTYFDLLHETGYNITRKEVKKRMNSIRARLFNINRSLNILDRNLIRIDDIYGPTQEEMMDNLSKEE